MKRIVCIGGWGHWPEVFQTLEDCEDVQICGIASAFDGEDLSTICSHKLMEDVPRFEKIDELLAVPADFCIVCTRPGHIAASIICAANAGLHIITEKPLGISLEELRNVEEALNKNNVRLMAIFSMRTYAVFQTARRLYKEGSVGRAVLLNARKSYKYGDEALRPEWFGRRSEYGGTFPWVGIHALDMIRFTTGLNAQRVAALQRNQAHLTRPDCEDTCCAVLELDEGVMATVSVDYFRPVGAATHGDDWIRIVGTDGIIEARENEGAVTLLKNTDHPQTVALDEPENIFTSFLDGREGLTDREDALALTKACLYARQAADENRILEIES